MSTTNANAEGQEVEDEFPEVEIDVAPVTERSRAVFAKTHNRPATAKFTEIFDDEGK